MTDATKFGTGYIMAESVEAILPDEGFAVQGVIARPPNPNACMVFTRGGHKLTLDMPPDQALERFAACRKPDPCFLEVEGSPEEALQLLAWLVDRTDLELTYEYDLEPRHMPDHRQKAGAPFPEQGWTVHQRRGGVNDKEWTMIALEDSPIEALRTAHQAFCDGR